MGIRFKDLTINDCQEALDAFMDATDEYQTETELLVMSETGEARPATIKCLALFAFYAVHHRTLIRRATQEGGEDGGP